MKKYFIIFMFLICLTGCNKDKYFTCKIDLYNELQEYKLDSIYKVYYEDSYVTKIEKKEIYMSKLEDTLKYLNQYKILGYENINNLYGKVEYSVKTKENEIIITSLYDMSLINLNKMVKDNYIDSNYVSSNRLTIGGIKNIYKEKGAICDI